MVDPSVYSLFGSSLPVTGIIEELGSTDTIFNKYGLVKCFDCKTCQLKIYCPYKETERVYMAIKDRYAASNIKQARIKDLLD